MWFEPGSPRTCDLIACQHPNFPIREDLIEFDTGLRTPIFDFRSCATTARLPALNGVQNTYYYCGSYFGYGPARGRGPLCGGCGPGAGRRALAVGNYTRSARSTAIR